MGFTGRWLEASSCIEGETRASSYLMFAPISWLLISYNLRFSLAGNNKPRKAFQLLLGVIITAYIADVQDWRGDMDTIIL